MLLNRCLRQPSEPCKFDVGNGIGQRRPDHRTTTHNRIIMA
jgi:hypothetical protein